MQQLTMHSPVLEAAANPEADLAGKRLRRNASENSPDWLKTTACAPRGRNGCGGRTLEEETAMPFFQKGDVRIRYEETGSGFPLLVTPGGGLNSRVSNWPTAVINAMEEFKNDFRCITMDQRNANPPVPCRSITRGMRLLTTRSG